jgi:diguanylate cyclase (GGDEF)-like protein
MGRPLTTLRFLGSLLAPGGVLVLATWAVQREDVVRQATEPYAAYFCFGALVAAVLLSWYYDQSRLLCCGSVVVLTVLSVVRPAVDSNIAQLAAVMLLPFNFSLVAVLKERGVMTLDGLFKVGIVATQAAGVYWIAQGNGFEGMGSVEGLPWGARLSFAVGALLLLTLVFRRRTKVEQGLLWALVAMFLGASHLGPGMSGPALDALFFYSGTAGLVLVFAVLEHGYDIAYRDELTGLPARRAFNNVMEQLGGTYAIAMCDVDHFKRFNDTYGHDVGDQVLRMVAAKLSQVGGGGRAFRYGGEEFLVVFRGRSAAEAEPFAESLRRSIADAGFLDSRTRHGPSLPVGSRGHGRPACGFWQMGFFTRRAGRRQRGRAGEPPAG